MKKLQIILNTTNYSKKRLKIINLTNLMTVYYLDHNVSLINIF